MGHRLWLGSLMAASAAFVFSMAAVAAYLRCLA
jgi:hypothetical protein